MMRGLLVPGLLLACLAGCTTVTLPDAGSPLSAGRVYVEAPPGGSCSMPGTAQCPQSCTVTCPAGTPRCIPPIEAPGGGCTQQPICRCDAP